MKHSRLGRRLAAAILSAAMLAALLPITALAAGDGSQPSPAVVETVPSGAASEAVQAFLDAVQAITIPEEIDDETGPALSGQIGAAFDAYEALTDKEAALEDVQAAAALLQQAADALTGGAQTMATTDDLADPEQTPEVTDETDTGDTTPDTMGETGTDDTAQETTDEPGTAPAQPLTPAEDPAAMQWDVSKSKTATNLDESFTSQITLSLPAKELEQTPAMDVVFVLDCSGSSKAARDEINSMLGELQKKQEKINIKVGVVNFDYKTGRSLDLTPLSAGTIDTINGYVTYQKGVGTNIENAIKKGVAMLDGDDTVPAENKYLILLTDGISHAWNTEEDGMETVWGAVQGDSVVPFNGANSYYYSIVMNPKRTKTISFETLYALSPNDASLNSGYEVPVFENDGTTEVAPATTTYTNIISGQNKYIKLDEYDTYLTGTEKGVYTAAHAYADAATKYHCISLYWKLEGYPVAAEFMEWTAQKGDAYDITSGKGTPSFQEAFENIKKEILYLLDKGSQVTDYIGYVEGDYDFDFVNEANSLSLKVGDATFQAVKIGDNTYTFDDGSYTLTYNRGNGKDEEHFVWDINVPVLRAAPVQLTYSVRLTNPKTAAGSYGSYDEDGSQGLSGLYTNNSAVLTPVNSKGETLSAEYFAKPTVSYTVSAPEPSESPEPTETPTPTESPKPSEPPAPTATPAATEAPKDDHPEIEQARKDGTWGKDDDSGSGTTGGTAGSASAASGSSTIPQTGDDFSLALWLVLLAAALAALVGLGFLRRRNSRD